MKNSRYVLLIIGALLAACNGNYTPKPMGYLKVEYPEKEYVVYDEKAPFTFEYPSYAEVVPSRVETSGVYWYNVNFPVYNGTLHLSYKSLEDDVQTLIGESRDLVYKHASQADGIAEIPFVDTANDRYGIMYELSGNVASAVQFFITDSTENFLRGSLYFRTTPNRDSLNPIINFVKEDVEHMIETIQWK